MRSHIASPRRRARWSVTGALTGLLLILTLPGALPSAAESLPRRGSAYMGIGVLTHDNLDVLAEDAAAMASQTAATVTSAENATRVTQTEGVDVSSYQGTVAWPTLWNSGVRWAYTKASEGTYYKNPSFTSQYDGALKAGMVRGAYHFATPDTTGGAAQADYFLAHGGGWTKDGKTLPGALDIEWNPYGDDCYGKSTTAMVTWIKDFLNRYKARTGRHAVIYTATSWWTQCTGNYAGFAANNPLWIARYASTVGTLPAGWKVQTMWQYTSSGATVGDHNRFNGALDRVKALATG
uniref:lysozyme n=1 Tax=Streptomyces corallincola TaxID=2851888 RepID=UPI003558620C